MEKTVISDQQMFNKYKKNLIPSSSEKNKQSQIWIILGSQKNIKKIATKCDRNNILSHIPPFQLD